MLENNIADIDYMAQQFVQNGMGSVPDQFYNNSFSNWIAAQNATSPKERMSPLELMRSLG